MQTTIQTPRDELLSLEECAQTKETYGQEMGLPVEAEAFVQHVKDLLTVAARKVDDAYPDNIFFEINDGRPKLSRFKKKLLPLKISETER